MNPINRFAIIVRPIGPFLGWASSFGDAQDDALEPWTSIYLIEAEDNDQPLTILRRAFAEIFEEQLGSWHRDHKSWPTPRTFSLFQQWFDAEVVDLVLDMSKGGIGYDD